MLVFVSGQFHHQKYPNCHLLIIVPTGYRFYHQNNNFPSIIHIRNDEIFHQEKQKPQAKGMPVGRGEGGGCGAIDAIQKRIFFFMRPLKRLCLERFEIHLKFAELKSEFSLAFSFSTLLKLVKCK